jgi:hypothetical protein
MRQQEKRFKELYQEFIELKNYFFPSGVMFRVIDASEKEKDARYQQLFQFFYPQFRTKNFINPL